MEDEFEIIRPDDPKYKELVSQIKNDKGASLIDGLHFAESELAKYKRMKKQGLKYTIPGLATNDNEEDPVRPINEVIAELEKTIEETKEIIDWAETKRPSSSRTENGSLLMQEYDKERNK